MMKRLLTTSALCLSVTLTATSAAAQKSQRLPQEQPVHSLCDVASSDQNLALAFQACSAEVRQGSALAQQSLDMGRNSHVQEPKGQERSVTDKHSLPAVPTSPESEVDEMRQAARNLLGCAQIADVEASRIDHGSFTLIFIEKNEAESHYQRYFRIYIRISENSGMSQVDIEHDLNSSISDTAEFFTQNINDDVVYRRNVISFAERMSQCRSMSADLP